jgi:putative ABC transport system permease protein
VSVQVAALATVSAIVGIAALVALGGLIFGPRAAAPQLRGFSPNVLTISASGGDASAPGKNNARFLTIADVDAIAHGVPDIAALSRAVFGTVPVVAGGQDGQVPVQAVDPSFAQVTSDTVAQGAFFTTQDATSANRVAVLGQSVSNRLFRDGQAPVGATIRIRDVPFTVIGVLAAQSSSGVGNPDDAVLVPFQTGQVRLFGANALDAVLVRVADADQTDAVSQDVEQLLRQRHQVRAGQPDGFTIRSSGRTAADGVNGTVGPLLDLARQYSCEAKGLCAPGR